MRAVVVAVVVAGAGCSVPYEVDPSFGLDAAMDSTADSASDSAALDTELADSAADTAVAADTLIDATPADAPDTLLDSASDSASDSATDSPDATADAAVDTIVIPPDTACSGDLTSDVNHCGACGNVCTTTDGTPACVASTCAIASCNTGYSSCDGDPGACELAHNLPSNTCATPQVLTSMGDPEFCGSGAAPSMTPPATTTASRFYKLTLKRCPPCTPSTPIRARISLANPSSAAYDLRVWVGSACVGAPTKTSASGVRGATETVTLDNLGCSNTDVLIEMRYRAGGSCFGSTLTATGAY